MTLLKKKLKHSFLLKARKVCEVTWWLHSYPLNRKCPQRVLSIKEGERNNPFSLLLMGAKCYLEIFWCLFSLQNVTIHRLLRGGVCQGSQSCGGACCSGIPFQGRGRPFWWRHFVKPLIIQKTTEEQSDSGIRYHLANRGGSDCWFFGDGRVANGCALVVQSRKIRLGL